MDRAENELPWQVLQLRECDDRAATAAAHQQRYGHDRYMGRRASRRRMSSNATWQRYVSTPSSLDAPMPESSRDLFCYAGWRRRVNVPRRICGARSRGRTAATTNSCNAPFMARRTILSGGFPNTPQWD